MTPESRKVWKDLGGALKSFWQAFMVPILVIVAIIALGLAYFCQQYDKAALVNGSPIARKEVVRELEKASGEQMLDALVTKKLITQKAKEAGIKISPSEIDEEVKKIEARVTTQGVGSLQEALDQQGLSMAEFREQITLQKALEKILADKIIVSDEEVAQYLASTKAKAPEGTSEEEFKNSLKEQLRSQKLGTEASTWLEEQKKNAKIEYFVPYAPKPAPEVLEAPAPAEAPAAPEVAPAPEAQK
jgi:parvulin-like peptidyl-prolyl isomerase